MAVARGFTLTPATVPWRVSSRYTGQTWVRLFIVPRDQDDNLGKAKVIDVAFITSPRPDLTDPFGRRYRTFDRFLR